MNNHFKGERGRVREASKEGEIPFRKRRKEALERAAQDEGVSMSRLKELEKEQANNKESSV